MIVALVLIAYVLIAAAALFFAVKWNNRFDIIDDWDSGLTFILIAVFWPIAFPLFVAYCWAHASSDSE